MLWLTGACGAIVFIEPSPYEVMSFLTLAVFVVGGLTLLAGAHAARRAAGADQHRLQHFGLDRARRRAWRCGCITSWYLAVTALFFAAMLGRQHRGAVRTR